MGTLARADEMVAELGALGVRAYIDPSLVNAPCVLIIPPNLTWDQMCAMSARWQLVAMAPAASVAERGSWEILEGIVDNVAKVVDCHDAQLVAYTVNGKQYPSYIITFQESI